MRNNQFWDECNSGSLRQAVADFLEHHPLLSRFKGEEYYEIEDAIVAFIEQIRQKVCDEVDREYKRLDIATKVVDDVCRVPKLWEQFYETFPARMLDELIEEIDEELENNDAYWDAYWGSFHSVLEKYKEYFTAWFDSPSLTLFSPKEWLKKRGEDK